MKTIEEKAKAYDEAIERAKKELGACGSQDCDAARLIFRLFPGLRESKGERIRQLLIRFVKYEMPDNYSDDFSKEDCLAWVEKQGEQKSTDKTEPKFKVKYAGSEYNVLEVKDVAGVTFYGIEDEPNHIDYVKAENCEIISGYAIKENGSPYPTKAAVFSEQSSAWSEEDKCMLNNVIDTLKPLSQVTHSGYAINSMIDWLKSLRPQNTWKPSDEQLKALKEAVDEHFDIDGGALWHLYEDLKKLKE